MRLRSKKWAVPFIDEHPDLIIKDQRAKQLKGNWSLVFGNNHPLYLEIGSGKGQFILDNAIKYPENNFIGLELQPTAVAIAGKKAFKQDPQLANLKLILGDGGDVSDYFADNEISKIFLNHSDPWPKAKHEKRRLTAENFLKSYSKILLPNGALELKTDNLGLFEYSLSSFKKFGLSWPEEQISYDLHHELKKNPVNIETEYEKKFAEMNQPEYWIRVNF
ncbi:tRNA (guanosine(46)-N7)-methyltransferase TrmB [Oenococcus oeni]|uniref:tRNA (guanine-N(7)-)-methyltransferase n=2 Tax=Oenococcus oeni TaxID=1247 RepID=A0NIW6_OENOE|nr:tRNA (guanosine(46)-N7)-methyltransferase TrmB [Oenococcus oeni]EAV39548.1 methyl transferase [Oenococcus oeni ATCC BAA-1163]EJO02562.1 S-adenosylmethionine-dependent methyltransferase [Oenococcus oeni AWRIB418]KDP19555.1 tRNA (guanine-N7)-methyltransferase [Oenococcus oeni]KEP88470.1 tRNA (guanine-N(7)-)-methyltransferase [Oenococcus oeni IOEB_0501]KGH60190.1 tRNA (guanine-N7)-methyltransferase [Oenococcus oeni IOEB_9805]